MKRPGALTVRQIFDDYQYEMVRISLWLEEIRISEINDADTLVGLLDRAERLEALIDLYAYLLACQGHNRAASS